MAISAGATARRAMVAVGVILLAMATPARWITQLAPAAETPLASPALQALRAAA